MDKIRAFIALIYQQRFWVLSVFAILVAVVCWMLSASELAKKYRTNRTAIDTQFTAMNSLNNQSFYPNPQVIKEDLQQTVKLSGMVEDLWKELYERQSLEVLFWPKVLGEEFISKVEQHKFGDPIGVVMRDRYLNYIKERFDGLLEIVKAKKLQGARGGTGGYGGGYGMGEGAYGRAEGGRGGRLAASAAVEDDSIVQWLDQAKLQQKLRWSKTPSALKIWVTQENLWVYETLLKVIAKTNEERGATRPDNAAIRVIVALEVGREAGLQKSPARILSPRGAGQEGGGEGMGGYGEGGMGMGMGGEGGMGMGGEGDMGMGRGMGGEGMGGYGEGGMGMGMGGLDREGGGGDAMLLAGRYLDVEGSPMDGDVETLAGEPYRRLPVRMVLLMDQRWISQLLVFCANQALPIEVQGLRVNPDKAAVGFGGQGRGGTTRMQGVNTQVAEGMATVYLRGVVSIYNPPNQEQLTVPGAEQDQQDQFADSNP